jgi:hypothetical protein
MKCNFISWDIAIMWYNVSALRIMRYELCGQVVRETCDMLGDSDFNLWSRNKEKRIACVIMWQSIL